MHLPNYKDGSIVNLMSSIESAFGGKPKYKPLKILSPSELSKSKNIVLLVVDGLGYEYLIKHAENTVFNKYKINKITSVFPTTTASAVTTFLTGVAPQQHAITGWFMYLKELRIVSEILPFVQRGKNIPLSKIVNLEKIFNQRSFFEKIKAQSYVVIPKEIVGSDYMFAHTKRAKKIPCNKSLSDYFEQIRKIINSSNCKKYIYAYWSEFDHLCHNYGIKSRQAVKYLEEISIELAYFLESIKETTVILTADHGFIDTPEFKRINLKKHPKLREALIFSLCGDPRLVYYHVRPAKTGQFENYIKDHLKNCCSLYKSEELIKKNYFGLFEPNEKLFDRVGDYTLIMKDSFIIKDFILGEKEHFNIGNHGGVSKEEMFVPLVIVDL